jgi:hypothetical protein
MAQATVGPGKVPISIVLYIDATFIKRGIPIRPIYCESVYDIIYDIIYDMISYMISYMILCNIVLCMMILCTMIKCMI